MDAGLSALHNSLGTPIQSQCVGSGLKQSFGKVVACHEFCLSKLFHFVGAVIIGDFQLIVDDFLVTVKRPLYCDRCREDLDE